MLGPRGSARAAEWCPRDRATTHQPNLRVGSLHGLLHLCCWCRCGLATASFNCPAKLSTSHQSTQASRSILCNSEIPGRRRGSTCVQFYEIALLPSAKETTGQCIGSAPRQRVAAMISPGCDPCKGRVYVTILSSKRPNEKISAEVWESATVDFNN